MTVMIVFPYTPCTKEAMPRPARSQNTAFRAHLIIQIRVKRLFKPHRQVRFFSQRQVPWVAEIEKNDKPKVAQSQNPKQVGH